MFDPLNVVYGILADAKGCAVLSGIIVSAVHL